MQHSCKLTVLNLILYFGFISNPYFGFDWQISSVWRTTMLIFGHYIFQFWLVFFRVLMFTFRKFYFEQMGSYLNFLHPPPIMVESIKCELPTHPKDALSWDRQVSMTQSFPCHTNIYTQNEQWNKHCFQKLN